MIKCKVIETFTLGQFDKLKNIKRIGREEKGKLFTNDTFECDEEMAKYLTNETKNPGNRPFVKIIEIISEQTKKEKDTTIRRRKKPIAKD